MSTSKFERVAVLTSGGDAPGMNAAIRAVVRAGIDNGIEVCGVKNGYAGLIAGDWQVLSRREVGGIMQLGGTILGSARCLEFKTDAGREKSVRQLRQSHVDALIVIGGNGSQTGSHALSQLGFPVVGVASTIDNDLFGSDLAIGVDTALNVALESVDRLRNTASSHHRAFLVEVMGRECGYLALMTAIAGGAEAVVLPESEVDPEALAAELAAAYDRGKSHAIVVVAEGSRNNSAKMMQHFQQHHERLGFKLRATTLGHVQRGGNPNSFDRILATQLGAAAIQTLQEHKTGVLIGRVGGTVTATPLGEAVSSKKDLDPGLLELANVMAK